GDQTPTPIPAARLEPDCHDREVSQPLDERGPATGVIRHRTALLLGQHHDVQTIFRHVDSAKREHLRIPSLLMRARAHATVRVWKKRLELQAHSRDSNPKRLRASGRDGGDVVNRPPSPLTMLLSRHTKRREFISLLGGAASQCPATSTRMCISLF